MLEFLPTIIMFYSICNTYHLTLLLSKRVKEIEKLTKIVLGGLHATLTAKATIKSCKWVDAIGIGEGEESIVANIESLMNNNYEKLLGLMYRINNNISIVNNCDLIRDLDTLPFIDYSLNEDIQTVKVVSIDVGRGCPYSCKFCSTKTFWNRKFRLKSTKRIIQEIEYLMLNYGITNFIFEHDLFTADKIKLLNFCNTILNSKLRIKWSCSARIDTLDENVIRVMSKSGCREIFLGIETGSKKMQKIINKNLDVNKVLPILSILDENSIHVTAYDCVNIQLHPFTILPGTEYYEQLKYKMKLDLEDCLTLMDFGSAFIEEEMVKKFICDNVELFSQYCRFQTVTNELFILESNCVKQ